MTDVEHQVSHGDVENLLKIVSYTVVGSLTKKFGKTNNKWQKSYKQKLATTTASVRL